MQGRARDASCALESVGSASRTILILTSTEAQSPHCASVSSSEKRGQSQCLPQRLALKSKCDKAEVVLRQCLAVVSAHWVLAVFIRGQSQGPTSYFDLPIGIQTQNGPAWRWPGLSMVYLALLAFSSPGLVAKPICDILQPPGGPYGNTAAKSINSMGLILEGNESEGRHGRDSFPVDCSGPMLSSFLFSNRENSQLAFPWLI